MKLKELAELLTIVQVRGDMNTEITGISINSKHLRPGEIFVCIAGIPGLQEDRHPYINDAIQAGAAAIVVERDVNVNVPTLKVPNARYALAALSAHFYGYPSTQLHLIGVTGTNGKTTTSHMIESILRYAGYRTGLMGNIGTKIGNHLHETDINTQDPHKLQENLRKMVDEGTQYSVMEVSSQGLDMGRVLGCDFRTAVFTNVTQDHLDHHKTMESYIAAKGLLFSRLGNTFSPDDAKRKFAVLNADDEASAYFAKITAAQVITYGIITQADVMAENIKLTAQGTTFKLRSFAGETEMTLNMIGTFNVYNALAAIAAALAEQIPLETVKQGLQSLQSVPGRMEIIDEGQDFLILVDYAHTPDGLENALATLREFAERRTITVFGCGGDRDRAKRPMMGRIAADYSDYTIVTSDNPRTEDPQQILRDIEKGLPDNGSDYELIEDRKQAIARAIDIAGSNDIVIIAGKGHETYQILADETVHLDDREEAREAIRRKRGTVQ